MLKLCEEVYLRFRSKLLSALLFQFAGKVVKLPLQLAEFAS